MKKLLKNRKGFTLIELMMVIAVIGILAAVLVPKIGATKTNAKLAGVDANVRQVQAHVEGMIGRYAHNANTFPNALVSVMNSGNPTDGINTPTAGDIQNPFDNTKYGTVSSGNLSIGTAHAVLIKLNKTHEEMLGWNGPKYAGVIRVNIVAEDNDITKVDIYAYDEQGSYLNSGDPVATVTP